MTEKIQMPTGSFTERTEQISEKQDYKKNIFSQITLITLAGSYGKPNIYIDGIKQLRKLLLSYIARNKKYRESEKKIKQEYKEYKKKNIGDRQKIEMARYRKYDRMYTHLHILIGDVGFLPELRGKFIEGKKQEQLDDDLYDE